MRSSTILALALPALTTAFPLWPRQWGHPSRGGPPQQNCISAETAYSIVEKSVLYLGHPNKTVAKAAAESLFTKNIQEYSDSVNSLIPGETLGQVVENRKQHYIHDTLSTPPLNVTTLDVVFDCSNVVWHWQFDGVGSGAERVRGFTLLKVDVATGKVYQEQVEFNSLAWAADDGFNITAPAGNPARK